MKKTLLGLVGWCVAIGLLIGDAWAVGPRGGGGGMRGGFHGAPGGGGRNLTPGNPGHHFGGNPAIGNPHNSSQKLRDFVSSQGQGFNDRAQDVKGAAADRAGQVRSTAQDWANQWTSTHPEPFTAQWYAQHPQAWQYTHPHADAFVAASTMAVATWLTVPAATVASGGGGAYYEGDVTVNDNSQPTDQTAATTEPELSETSTTDLKDDGEWLGIGVYQLKSPGEVQANRVIQLAVNREGTVRGSHYDRMSDDVQDLQGTVSRTGFQVTWTIGKAGKAVFESSLDELDKPQGNLTVRYPNGATETWTTVKVQK